MRKTIKRAMSACIIASLLLTGCGKSSSNSSETTIEAPKQGEGAIETTMNYDFEKGKTVSLLTGEMIDEKVAKNRIIACMINNIDVAMPQSGIGNADIVYECVVEGGITRLMGIFQDYKKLTKLGPVRSARHYYVDIANEYDAIYTHFGQTKYATSEIKAIGIDTLSGLSALGGTVFYRDSARVAPHNAYTSGKGIKAGIKKSKYEKENILTDSRFDFNLEQQSLEDENAKKANKVTLRMNDYSKPWFEYNKKKGTYYRWQYGNKHIDDQTGKQLSYENIIIQFANYSDIDHNGYQDIDLVSSGKGYYVTEGKYIPIKWSKKSKNKMTNFYTMDGQDLKVNPGKTWISVFPVANKKGVTFN